jgi:hypothetical protein
MAAMSSMSATVTSKYRSSLARGSSTRRPEVTKRETNGLGAFDEVAAFETGSGADEGDEVRCLTALQRSWADSTRSLIQSCGRKHSAEPEPAPPALPAARTFRPGEHSTEHVATSAVECWDASFTLSVRR